MRIRDRILRFFTRLIMPDLADEMEADGTMNMPRLTGAFPEAADCCLIEDRGSENTLFVFSGIDALFAGQSRYHFQKVLSNIAGDMNVVFFRDMRKTGFQIAPDGTPTGREYFENRIRDAVAQLGSTRHMALGSSGGGQAAFYYAIQCQMDYIVAFGPSFPISVYTHPLNVLKSLIDIRALIRNPTGYFEVISVTFVATFAGWIIKYLLQGREFWDVRALYEDAGDARPHATVFYGAWNGPDTRQARLIEPFPQVTLRPIPTARHNTPAELKSKGLLEDVLRAEFDAFRAGGGKASTRSK